MSLQLHGVVRNGRLDIAESIDLPDGTKVAFTLDATNDDGPMTPAEIARVLSAMERVEPLEISVDVAVDLDAWEEKLNRHGIEHAEAGIEDVFR